MKTATRNKRKRREPQVECLEGRQLLSTLTVNTLTDNAPGSLRAEIQAANLNPGADTIVFDPSLTGGTIALTSGELSVTDDLEIDGLGTTGLAISGLDKSRIFNVSGNITFDLKDITLEHGFDPINGGAIKDLNSTVNATDVLFINNHAKNDGGAIVAGPAAHLNVDSSSFVNNKSDNIGGAIATYGFTTVDDSLFLGNKAVAWGGAVFNMGTSTDLYDNEFISNSTSNPNGAGGAVMSWKSPITLEYDSFLANTSANGGAYAQLGGVATMDHGQFIANTATGHGGAIFVRQDTPITQLQMTNTDVTFNDAVVDGGGVWASIGVFSPLTSTITYNTPDDVHQV